jgi:hypothetical protein
MRTTAALVSACQNAKLLTVAEFVFALWTAPDETVRLDMLASFAADVSE